jgi:hypothetical protein
MYKSIDVFWDVILGLSWWVNNTNWGSGSITVLFANNYQGWYAAHMKELWNAYIILEEKPEGNKLLRRPSYIWEDTIKVDLRDTGCE